MENISPLPVEITFHLFNDSFKVPPFQVGGQLRPYDNTGESKF